jgi:hypothetical protein
VDIDRAFFPLAEQGHRVRGCSMLTAAPHFAKRASCGVTLMLTRLLWAAQHDARTPPDR